MDKEHKNKGRTKEIKGSTGNKMGKTVKVTVSTLEAHPMYKKIIKKEKFFAHTEEELEVGTKVTIKESAYFQKGKMASSREGGIIMIQTESQLKVADKVSQNCESNRNTRNF